MEPLRRYFGVYQKWDGERTQKVVQLIGRFHNNATAIATARDYEFQYGITLDELRRETAFEAAWSVVSDYALEIVFAVLRIVRIGLAGVLGLYAWVVLFESKSIGDVPFSQLTLSMVTGALFRCTMFVFAGWLCWWIAFGASGRTPAKRR